MSNPIILNGIQVSYYFFCHRMLWLFSKQITHEHTSELVEIGRIIQETSFNRKRKEIYIDSIKIDFIEPTKGIIHEVKKSPAIEVSATWQLKYYLYYFKKLGFSFLGVLHYPKLRIKKEITLTEKDEEVLMLALDQIIKIINNPLPPQPKYKSGCKKCSYFEFCFI